MVKVIIFQENGALSKDLKITKNEKIVIITTKNAAIPVALIPQLMESSARLEYVEDGTIAEYAFLLGKIAATEGVSSVITDYEELQELISPKKKKSSITRKSKNNTTKEVKEEGPGDKTNRTTSKRISKKATSAISSYDKIKRSEIESVLKKNSFDTVMANPVMEALKTANDVTLDLMIRTHVAGFCETQDINDKELAGKVSSVICDYINK